MERSMKLEARRSALVASTYRTPRSTIPPTDVSRVATETKRTIRTRAAQSNDVIFVVFPLAKFKFLDHKKAC
jgi:hypothetical protein